MCCTLESTLFGKELFYVSPHAKAFPRKLSAIVVKGSLEHKKYMLMSMTELRSDWFIGYYVLERDENCCYK